MGQRTSRRLARKGAVALAVVVAVGLYLVASRLGRRSVVRGDGDRENGTSRDPNQPSQHETTEDPVVSRGAALASDIIAAVRAKDWAGASRLLEQLPRMSTADVDALWRAYASSDTPHSALPFLAAALGRVGSTAELKRAIEIARAATEEVPSAVPGPRTRPQAQLDSILSNFVREMLKRDVVRASTIASTTAFALSQETSARARTIALTVLLDHGDASRTLADMSRAIDEHSDEGYAKSVVAALASIDAKVAETLLPETRAWYDEYPHVRGPLALALSRTLPPSTAFEVLRRLAGSELNSGKPGPEPALSAIEALGRREEALPVLLNAHANESDSRVRLTVLRALARSRSDEAAKVLVRSAYEAPALSERRYSITALPSVLAPDRALSVVSDVYRTATDDDIRRAALEAAAVMPSHHGARALLEGALSDTRNRSHVRAVATLALQVARGADRDRVREMLGRVRTRVPSEDVRRELDRLLK